MAGKTPFRNTADSGRAFLAVRLRLFRLRCQGPAGTAAAAADYQRWQDLAYQVADQTVT
jgi:hypothetical protein